MLSLFCYFLLIKSHDSWSTVFDIWDTPKITRVLCSLSFHDNNNNNNRNFQVTIAISKSFYICKITFSWSLKFLVNWIIPTLNPFTAWSVSLSHYYIQEWFDYIIIYYTGIFTNLLMEMYTTLTISLWCETKSYHVLWYYIYSLCLMYALLICEIDGKNL